MHNSHDKKAKKGKISYLESPQRRKEFSPEQLLNRIPVKETDSILDFGAGTGYFSIPAAKRIKGNLYAMDIDATMLENYKGESPGRKAFEYCPGPGKYGGTSFT